VTDQPWVPDPEALSALRDSLKEALADGHATPVGPDPNADLLKQARGKMIEAFRASNPEIYDKLSKEFSAQFGGALRQGIGMGFDLAIAIVKGVVTSAQDDNDVSPGGHSYLQAIVPTLREVAKRAQGELGGS
jgi:hypothetical protein